MTTGPNFHYQWSDEHGAFISSGQHTTNDNQLHLFKEDEVPDPDRLEEIVGWWEVTAHLDAEKTVPKAVEYGSADLAVMGAAMRQMAPRGEELPERACQEMAIAFYLLGKVARMFGAYAEGRLPSDDTWFDATVYTMMGRRVRQFGEWG